MLTTIDPLTDPAWDDFAADHPEARVYHHSAWARVLGESFGFEPAHMALRDPDGGVSGIVAAMRIRRPLARPRLLSLPLTAYCNPLLPAESLRDLTDFFRLQQASLSFIELRLLWNGDDHVWDRSGGFEVAPATHVTHILALEASEEELLGSFHGRSVRHRIRRASRENLTFRLGHTEAHLRRFYDLMSARRRDRGLPPHPYRFFRNMWRILHPLGLMTLPLVLHEGQVVGAGVVLKWKRVHHLEYMAAEPRYFRRCVNQLLIWETIRNALAEGARYYDFGRSSLQNQSLIEFKGRWGTERRALRSVFFPECPGGRHRSRALRDRVVAMNRRLPHWLLRLQGRLVYRYHLH